MTLESLILNIMIVCLKLDLSFHEYYVGCDIKQELSLVKNKIYSELIADKGVHAYQPEMFRGFCMSAGATNIFDAILDAIVTSARHSAEHSNLHKKGLCRLFKTFATVCVRHTI